MGRGKQSKDLKKEVGVTHISGRAFWGEWQLQEKVRGVAKTGPKEVVEDHMGLLSHYCRIYSKSEGNPLKAHSRGMV